jgi:hypothetical protein
VRLICDALSGLGELICHIKPRALPWAIMFSPFGATDRVARPRTTGVAGRVDDHDRREWRDE